MKATRLLLAFLVGWLILGHSPGAWACSCVDVPRGGQVADATVVFTGRAVGSLPVAGAETSGARNWLFDVERIEKGQHAERIVVRATGNEPACGFEFRVRTRYEVFASRDDTGTLSTMLCTGTSELVANMDRSQNFGSPMFDGRSAVFLSLGSAGVVAAMAIALRRLAARGRG